MASKNAKFAKVVLISAKGLLLGTIIEKKLNWPFHEVVGLLVISVIVGAIVFFGSTYQIYTTIKYRDLLINKKIIKKD